MVEYYNLDLFWCFNCKEVKDYGEGGNLVGVLLEGWVLIIDDVIIVGIVICEVMELIDWIVVCLAGVVVVLDCQEKGKGELFVIQEVEKDFFILVISIVNLNQFIYYMEENVVLFIVLLQYLDNVKVY